MGQIVIVFLILYTVAFSEKNSEKYYLKDFRFEKMAGSWYEIVRKDNIYENNLDYAVTTYTATGKNEFIAVTTGFNTEKNKNTVTKGKGRIKNLETENIIEVKFFNLFYSEYVILDYDRKNYSYILIKGSSSDYLWILSREPTLPEETIKKLLKVAEKDGINIEDLTYVKQK